MPSFTRASTVFGHEQKNSIIYTADPVYHITRKVQNVRVKTGELVSYLESKTSRGV